MRKSTFKFSLRTMMVVVTLACALSAGFGYIVSYRAWRSSLRRDQGRYTGIYVTTIRDPDTKSVISKLRTRLGKLPNHAIVARPMDVGIDPMEATNLPVNLAKFNAKILDHWTYCVKLRDGSDTQIGIWVRDDGKVNVLIYAWDTNGEVQSGAAAKRRAERHELKRVYSDVIFGLESEYQKSLSQR